MNEDFLKEIEDILSGLRDKSFSLDLYPELRADLSVLCTMLADYSGGVYEDMLNSEYERKKFQAERGLEYRRGMVVVENENKKHTAADAENMALIDAEPYYKIENEMKGLYRKLENKRQAILKVVDSLSAIKHFNHEEGTD